MTITELSNEQLLSCLRTVVGDERRLVAKVLAYLGEVEARGLHLAIACSSMFDFCTRKLGFSEDQACRRIAVARLGRTFPAVLDAIAEGKVHLSAVNQLRELFTQANVDELLAAATGKSRREIEHLIARLAPKPDVPESIRKLPEQARIAAAKSEVTSPVAVQLPHAMKTSVLVPLSAERFRVTLTASAELHEKIETARALMRHCNPSGDLAKVLERALDLLIELLEKERLGKVKHPRRSRGTKDPADVTRETRREVYERDGGQCAFVAASGERCPARDFLELDHRHPRALGGDGSTENVRLLCHAHNQHVAEQAFGRKHMEAKRRRTKKGPTGAATHSAVPAPDATGSRPAEAQRACADSAIAGMGATVGAPVDAPSRARASETPTAPTDPRQRGDHRDAVASATSGLATNDSRSPHDIVHAGLIHLGFRAKDADRALAGLPLAVWTEPLEAIMRKALSRLT